jgi:hypothetical protein
MDFPVTSVTGLILLGFSAAVWWCGRSLEGRQMAKVTKTAKELETKIMREARASGKCRDLLSVTVPGADILSSNWKIGTASSNQDNPTTNLRRLPDRARHDRRPSANDVRSGRKIVAARADSSIPTPVISDALGDRLPAVFSPAQIEMPRIGQRLRCTTCTRCKCLEHGLGAAAVAGEIRFDRPDAGCKWETRFPFRRSDQRSVQSGMTMSESGDVEPAKEPQDNATAGNGNEPSNEPRSSLVPTKNEFAILTIQTITGVGSFLMVRRQKYLPT